MEKISVTRALADLKVIKKRIASLIDGAIFVDAYQNRSTILGRTKKSQAEFKREIEAASQSINDLMSRHDRIKAAIVDSNAKTKIKICGDEITVAAAIERKQSIEFKKTLLKKMREQWAACKTTVDKDNSSLEDSLEKLLTSMYGSDKKTDPAMFEETSKAFRQQNEIRIFDPVGVEKQIATLENYISSFEGEVDFALSEANAKTEIEI